MKLLSLNCRGLGNPETVQELHDLVKQEAPQVVFLMETQLEVGSMEWIRVKLGFAGSLAVNRVRFGGGLALMWDMAISVSVQSYSNWHIDAKMKSEEGVSWRFTGFYGHPEKSKRQGTWDLLRRLGEGNSKPWLVAGDFNEILVP
jgi:hypothetical protein